MPVPMIVLNHGKTSPQDANDVYPKQVIVDFYNNPCPLGVTARYDRSLSMEDLKAAIDERYGQWRNQFLRNHV